MGRSFRELGAIALLLSVMMPASAQQHKRGSMETAVFGGGCFWCVEAVFEEVPGVQSVVSGYAGGPAVNPTYDAVCTGQTGHAEVVQVTFDPSKVAYARLLETFWKAHDPTTLNRQGADAGTQYRSIILYQNDAQRITAETSRTEAQKRFTQPIVTELQPLAKFYPAEEYHQDYFRKNPNAAYCRAVIKPKLDKLKSTTK